jgi:capsular polysaccharide biosynthesis protein/AcrR family transcriptional regulator
MELKDYLHLVRRWLWLLAAGTVVAMVACYVGLRLLGPWPAYEAKAIIVVDSGEDNVAAAQALRSAYVELADEYFVIQRVIDSLNLSRSPGDLARAIRINPVGQTQLIEVIVTASDAQYAAAVANEMAYQLTQVPLINRDPTVREPDVYILSPATIPAQPNSRSFILILIAGALGLMLSTSVVLLIEHLDTTIRTPQDIEQLVGPPVLGVVHQPQQPLFDLLETRLQSEWSRAVLNRLRSANGSTPSPGEVFRWVWVSMYKMEDSHPFKVLITSPTEAENRAELGVRIAQAWAEIGQEIVLIKTEACRVPQVRWFSCVDGDDIETSHLLDIEAWSDRLHTDGNRLCRSANRATRLRNIESLLFRSPDGLRVTDIAEKCGVNRRTVYRDIELLIEADVPIWHEGERYGIIRDRYLATVHEAVLEAETQTEAASPPDGSRAILPGGSDLADAVEPLMGQLPERQLQAVETLVRQANVAIVDGLPVLATANTTLWASHVDSILLVCEAGKTRVEEARKARDMLTRAGGHVTGALLLHRKGAR